MNKANKSTHDALDEPKSNETTAKIEKGDSGIKMPQMAGVGSASKKQQEEPVEKIMQRLTLEPKKNRNEGKSSSEMVHELNPMSELRIQVLEKGEKVSVALVSGSAEHLGAELTKNIKYELEYGKHGQFFTYQGCSLHICGKVEVQILSREIPMKQYKNYHQTLDHARAAARKEHKCGPIVMVTGPSNVGKSSVTRILLNYAIKANGRLLYVDLDPGQGALSIPGTIATVFVETPANVAEDISGSAPLIYHFGHTSPQPNVELYRVLVSKMAERTLALLNNSQVKYSGIIINTCGWVKDAGYFFLKHIAKSFKVTNIVVLHEESLYENLRRHTSDFVNVSLLPKFDNCPKPKKNVNRKNREQRIHKYFYGDRVPHQAYMLEVGFDDLKVFHTTQQQMKSQRNNNRFVAVTPTESMEHRLLALTSARSLKDDIISTTVYAFFCVIAVDMNYRTVKLLSPHPGPLPKKILLLSEVEFPNPAK